MRIPPHVNGSAHRRSRRCLSRSARLPRAPNTLIAAEPHPKSSPPRTSSSRTPGSRQMFTLAFYADRARSFTSFTESTGEPSSALVRVLIAPLGHQDSGRPARSPQRRVGCFGARHTSRSSARDVSRTHTPEGDPELALDRQPAMHPSAPPTPWSNPLHRSCCRPLGPKVSTGRSSRSNQACRSARNCRRVASCFVVLQRFQRSSGSSRRSNRFPSAWSG